MPLKDLPDLPEDEETEEEEGGEEEEEEEEEVEEPAGVGAAPPPPPPEPAPKRRRGRPRTREPKGFAGPASPAAPRPPSSPWISRDVENLWPEILAWLQTQGRTPYEVDIRVKRTEPQEMLIGASFNGGSVMGTASQSASDQIVEKITNEYHLIGGAQGPATYKVEFLWRVNSAVIKVGQIRLASPEQIVGIRNQQRMNAQHQPYQPQGYGAQPPRYEPPPYNPYGPPPQPFQGYSNPYQPPPSQGFGAPPVDSGVMQELAYLRGTLSEALSAAREGRQPNIQPPPMAPPTLGAMPSVDDIARRVVDMLRGTSAGVAAPAQPLPSPMAQPVIDPIQLGLQNVTQTLLAGVLKKVTGSIEGALRGDGLGAIPQPTEQPDEATAEVVDPSDGLPFNVTPIPDSKWADGRQVNFVRNKESGNIDPTGSLMANPWIAEKLSEAVGGLLGSVGEVVKTMARSQIPGASEVVNSTPRGAVNAGVGHVSGPSTRSAPPPAQAPQAPPPAAPSNGGGWPKS